MSKPANVGIEDIARAALKLQAGGKVVTTRRVREELGYGSYSTISRLLGELGLRALEMGSDLQFPVAIRLQAVTLVRTVWRAAEAAQVEKASEANVQWRLRLSILVKQLNEERRVRCANDKKFALLYGERDRWRSERKTLKQRIVALTKEPRRTGDELHGLRARGVITSSSAAIVEMRA